MFRRWLLVSVAVGCLSAGSAAGSNWDYLPELFADFGIGGASNSVLDDGSSTSVSEWGGDLWGGLTIRRGFDDGRAVDIGLFAGGSKLWQSEGSTVEPSSYAFQMSVDGDLPFELGRLKRVTLGGLAESGAADFGDLDYGNWTRYLAVGMLTWQLFDDECELGNTTFFVGREDFDDTLNEGSPTRDRSADDVYELAGIEQSWVFADLDEVDEACFRAGPFRRTILNDYHYLRGGWNYRKEDTRGDTFDARVNTWHLAGNNPVTESGMLAIEWRAGYTLIDYTQPREDDSVELRAGPRWSIGVLKGSPWFRYFDVRLAASWIRRDSNLDQFDYDRWAMHVGISIHIGPLPEGGDAPQGSSRVDRRDGAGGSEPAVQEDLDP